MDRHLLHIDPHSPMYTGVRGRCPRCGEGKLFKSLLTLAPACEKCGLDFSFADPADGPAFFVMSITSFLAVGLLFILQAFWRLPEWALLAIVTITVFAASIALLVPIKGWLVNSQYFYKAGEGVLAGPVSSAPCQCENCKVRYSRAARGNRGESNEL
ncbi:MAG: DUF983 domain-containing protein [Terricaulis sp.]|nr:DUF983 domain-containing protein [Terricaulis sp.]